MIRVSTVKCALWFCTVMLIVLAFPIQVYAHSPYPSLLPYIVIAIIAATDWMSRPQSVSLSVGSQGGNIKRIIGIYVALVLASTAWQTAFGMIDSGTGATALVVYVLPAGLYWYFRRRATDREIRSFLWAMVAAGIIVGLFFAYDSYGKFALGQASEYAKRAFQYSVDRSGRSEAEANTMRVLPYSRSFGLLETHSVSGVWIILGAFAALALVPEGRKLARRLIVLISGVLLLLGLNFTAIVAFTVMAFFLEFGGFSLLRGRISTTTALNIVSLIFIFAAIAVGVLSLAGDVWSVWIVANLLTQRDLALGSGSMSLSYAGIFMNNIRGYLNHVDQMPFTLLFGDGYGTYGGAKGGDIGIVETLERFGLPLFATVGAGLIVMIRSELLRLAKPARARVAEDANLDVRRTTQFSVAVLMLVLITEGHYTIWSAKSVLPIVFFALALCDRNRVGEPARP